MGDAFLDPILERVARSQRAGMRIGTLTAIDAPDASVTVDCASDVIPGVRWVGSYSPTVGDKVVVSRVGSMWIILGKMSKQIGVPTVIYGEVILPMFTGSQGSFYQDIPTAPLWNRSQTVNAGACQQGRIADRLKGGAWWCSLPSLEPDATVTSATLTIARDPGPAQGAPLVAPVLYWHPYQAQTWYYGPGGGEAGTFPTLSGGPWRPGTLAGDQRGVWDLPSAWLTAFLAGTARGIAIYSNLYDEFASFGGSNTPFLTIRYTTPV